MALKDDLDAAVKKIFKDQWYARDGQKVPEDTDVGLGNDAVKLDAVILYADLSDSTQLVNSYKPLFAAEVYKTYLYCASKIIREFGGVITAFDGDRIMAVYLGDSKNSSAAKSALKIQGAVVGIIRPAMSAQYPNTPFVLKQKVGVDSSDIHVAKTGIRGSNDLVWVGKAANYAAKMAALPDTYSTYISAEVYGRLDEGSKYSTGTDMWTDLGTAQLGRRIYGSAYNWSL